MVVCLGRWAWTSIEIGYSSVERGERLENHFAVAGVGQRYAQARPDINGAAAAEIRR
jgi:hypothetical protein